MNSQPNISLDSGLWTSLIYHKSQGVPLQGSQVQIIHACKLWCTRCARVACALTTRPKYTSCIEPQRKREIHRTFLNETIQALDAQINPMALLSFQPRDTPNLKGWSDSAKEMCQKRQQERRSKSEIISTGRIYFDRTLVTSITLPSDWEPKYPTDILLACTC